MLVTFSQITRRRISEDDILYVKNRYKFNTIRLEANCACVCLEAMWKTCELLSHNCLFLGRDLNTPFQHARRQLTRKVTCDL